MRPVQRIRKSSKSN
jgi:hypothetical protein